MTTSYMGAVAMAAVIAAGFAMPAQAAVDPGTAESANLSDDGSAGQNRTADLQEIVVTARKRAESIQNVPISVTAVTAALVEQKNIVKIDQLAQLVPNTFMRSSGVITTELNTYIRGIGDRSSEPSQDIPIAESIDGVYLANTAGSLVDVFDIQQVEVLRGPQGTLQGRNSPAGAVNITTRRPTGEYALRTQVSYENYNNLQLKAFAEAPIVKDVLAVKVSAFDNHGGNFMLNELTGKRGEGGTYDAGGRVGLLYTPMSNFKAYLTADYTNDTSPPGPLRPRPHAGTLPPPLPGGLPEPAPKACTAYGFCTAYPEYSYGSNFSGPQHGKIGGSALNADWDVGPVTITSVTGYRYVDQVTTLDNDALPATILNVFDRRVKVNSESEELRVASNGNNRLTYVGGVYYLHSHFDFSRSTTLGGGVVGLPTSAFLKATTVRHQNTDSYAVFGQASYEVIDKWSLSGGIRQSWDKKDLIATPTLTSGTGEFKANFSKPTAELGTEYRFDVDKMLYFRFSQGYRAGGLNGAATSLLAVNVYKPETVNAYEVGLKSEWFQRRLTANLTAFHYNYHDLQIGAVQFEPLVAGFTTRLVNARGLKTDGLEFETNYRPTDALTITGNVSYLHAKYLSQILNLGGGAQQMADVPKDSVPKFSGFLGVDYNFPLTNGAEFVWAGGVQYKGAEMLNPLVEFIGYQPAYALVDSSLTYRNSNGKFSIALYGQNLFDKYYKINGDSGTNIFEWDIVGRPRTYGVRLIKDF